MHDWALYKISLLCDCDSALALFGSAMFLYGSAAHLLRLARGSTSVLSYSFLALRGSVCVDSGSVVVPPQRWWFFRVLCRGVA